MGKSEENPETENSCLKIIKVIEIRWAIIKLKNTENIKMAYHYK